MTSTPSTRPPRRQTPTSDPWASVPRRGPIDPWRHPVRPSEEMYALAYAIDGAGGLALIDEVEHGSSRLS